MGWEASLPVLRQEQPYQPEEMPRLVPGMLPPNERRRATRTIRLALAACQEAMEKSPQRAEQVASVFASSDGDAELLDKLCTALAKDSPVVSPFEFHNSVHNAPAGYWSIATGAHTASTSICAFDASFSCGLIEAVAQVGVEEHPVLLAAYDQPLPPPLDAKRHLVAPFATALLLASTPSPADMAVIGLQVVEAEEAEDRIGDSEMERLRLGNAAARGLPLLMALAKNETLTVRLPYMNGTKLLAELAPC